MNAGLQTSFYLNGRVPRGHEHHARGNHDHVYRARRVHHGRAHAHHGRARRAHGDRLLALQETHRVFQTHRTTELTRRAKRYM